jgi:NADH-quinone oxidoreductase subunit F
MSNFETLVSTAGDEWAEFSHSSIPKIYLGTASCGKAAGAEAVKKAILASLKKYKVQAQLVEVGCIGACYLEPIMDIEAHNFPRVSYGNVDALNADIIIKKYLVNKDYHSNKVIGHFGKEDLPDVIPFFEQPMLKPQVRIVLKNCGLIDPENLHHYLAHEGYQGLQQALKLTPDEVISIVADSGLRGRGGAGFPTGRKWRFCRDNVSDKKYMICNADEGDPGAFMNRSLIEGDPHALLEGLLIAAYAIGASKGFIYIRAEYPLAIQRLRKAISELKNNNLLGKNILGTSFSFDITIKEGAGAFVCGEETALIHSIEGKRGMPGQGVPSLHNQVFSESRL